MSGRDGERKGWREEGFNPAWIMVQTAAGEQEEIRRWEIERGSPTVPPSVHLTLCLVVYYMVFGLEAPGCEDNRIQNEVSGECLRPAWAQDWTSLKTEVLPGRLEVFHCQHVVCLNVGTWRREGDDGSRRNRFKKSGTMARLRCNLWCAGVTFDTGDESFLDSAVCRGNQLSWQQIIRHLICYLFCLDFLSRPTCLKGNSCKSFGHMTLWVIFSAVLSLMVWGSILIFLQPTFGLQLTFLLN